MCLATFFSNFMQKKYSTKSYKTIFKYLKPYKKEFFVALFFTIIEASLEMFVPFLMNYLLSLGVYLDNANRYQINQDYLILISLIMVVCAVLAFIFGTISSKFIANTCRKFGALLRVETYKKIQNFSFNNIDQLRQSSLITRLTDDNQIIQNTFCTNFRPLIRAPMLLICSVIFSLIISPILSLILFLAMLILCITYAVIITKVRPRYIQMQSTTDLLNQDTQEAIKNVKTIKSFVKEDYEISKFNNINDNLRLISNKSYGMTALSMPVMNLVIFATIIIILYVGGIFVIDEKFAITTVNISAFLTYLNQSLGAFRMINNSLTNVNRADASVNRTSEILDTEIDLQFNKNSKLKITNGDVVFQNVYYKTTKTQNNYVLNNINLNIKSGETIGIVGPTGSGKSTLVNLIDRFYDASEGEILVSNNSVKLYNEYELHKNIGFCFQNPLLFKGTVLDNLKFGNKDASMDEVIKACKIACCYDFILNQLENGFAFMISEGGTNVSGGQRQRLCIARAIILNPKILIFDDSFSALDALTEKTVKNNLKNELHDVTKIIISEKISTIEDADKIIVIDNGNIINIGKNDYLIENNKIYHDMVKSQKRGAIL